MEKVNAVIDAALTADTESSVLVALNRIANHTGHVSDPEDVVAVYVAGRVARGKQVTAAALCDLGARYLALLVELSKQVDARMSAERDLAEERAAKVACKCPRLGECRACFERRTGNTTNADGHVVPL